MPGPARPLAPYSLLEPRSTSRGQRRGIVRVDMRTRHGRLLKQTRAALLEHVGPNASVAQRSMCERIAFLELRCAIFDQKMVDGTFTGNDANTYYALVGAMRRCYSAIGLERAAPKFAELMRPPGRPRKGGTDAA